jgi:hypothetical protein
VFRVVFRARQRDHPAARAVTDVAPVGEDAQGAGPLLAGYMPDAVAADAAPGWTEPPAPTGRPPRIAVPATAANATTTTTAAVAARPAVGRGTVLARKRTASSASASSSDDIDKDDDDDDDDAGGSAEDHGSRASSQATDEYVWRGGGRHSAGLTALAVRAGWDQGGGAVCVGVCDGAVGGRHV